MTEPKTPMEDVIAVDPGSGALAQPSASTPMAPAPASPDAVTHDQPLPNAPATQQGNAPAEVAPSFLSSFFGPALQLFGVLLWCYVVVGQYVVKANVPEALGLVVVVGVYLGSWYRLVQHRRGGALLWVLWPGIAGLCFTGVAVALVSSLFGSSRREAEGVTLALWAFALIVYFVGRSSSDTPRRPAAKLGRAMAVGSWLVISLATAAALFASIERL